MTGEKDLDKLIKTMKPIHNTGIYVFCRVERLTGEHLDEAVFIFKEAEGNTIVIKKRLPTVLTLNTHLLHLGLLWMCILRLKQWG